MESLKLSSFAAETHLLACYAARFFFVDSVLASLSVLAWLQWMLITKNVMLLSFLDVEPYTNQCPNLADYNNKGKAVVESDGERDTDDDDSDDGYGDPDDDDDLSSDDSDDVEDSDDEDEDSDEDDTTGGGGDDDDDDDNDDDDTDTDDEDDDDEEDDEDAPPNKKFK